MSDRLPDWLEAGLLCEEKLPWPHAVKTSFAKFLEDYTLHDSNWIGFVLQPNRSGIMALWFDAVWARDRLKLEPLVLLVRFDPIYHVVCESSDYGVTIGGAKSTAVSQADRESLLQLAVGAGKGFLAEAAVLDEGLCQTVIEDICGGHTSILHGAQVMVLCLSESGDVREMPGLQ